ncbi:hypothetical protein K470DRAFT_281460 [Piedraia hortae CBS 480.64]|uniref:FAD/NAD(P)-binding domain-containing protein n=1 Tax=Piedraia hortae CBS 480.64 TaxID=1314780 RepID=A0A6A7C1S8_9PEZI|nr:hypothetical protein K470DRAFT_281460 [Piedraia hortae CBS 480.64]
MRPLQCVLSSGGSTSYIFRKDLRAFQSSSLHTRTLTNSDYAATIVGAGPAGVTCVGNLLEKKIEPILWIDDEFSGGRVNKRYREVPSNTKVGLFVDFATAVEPFRQIINDCDPVEMRRLRALDQSKGCELGYAADMILMLTRGLQRMPGISSQKTTAKSAVLDERTGRWTVDMGKVGSSVTSQRLILCTGSTPSIIRLPYGLNKTPLLDLDSALSPTLLKQILLHRGPTVVSVIGASHSAILVLRNLYNLAASAKPDLHIRWLTRHELRYAVYMDGWILRDNTGLKGEAAEWAKANLERGVFDQSNVSRYVTAIRYQRDIEQEVFKKHLAGSDLICQAIGYKPNPIPKLETQAGEELHPVFDHQTGAFTQYKHGSLVKLPGLYGAGIAWPQVVRDPHGNMSFDVGFWKFMKFVKRMSPSWN